MINNKLSMTKDLMVVAMAINSSSAFISVEYNQQFSHTGPNIVSRTRSMILFSRRKHTNSVNNRSRIIVNGTNTANDVDYDDGGWGDDEVDSITRLERNLEQSWELIELQDDLVKKRTRRQEIETGTVKGGSENKDLFIPIVTLVSVIGFTGLYGYEMLRLYVRGELYLPWEN